MSHKITPLQKTSVYDGGREYPPGGVSTPGHGQGEGPARYKLFAEQMTQEMVGGAGVERSGTESSGRVLPSSTLFPQYFSL